MSAQVRFNTVLPNNTIERAMDFTAVSQVYKDKTNIQGSLEHVFRSNDVYMSFPSVRLGDTTTIYIPPTYKLLGNVVLKIQMGDVINRDFAILPLIDEIHIKFAGSVRIIHKGYNLLYAPLEQIRDKDQRFKFFQTMGVRGMYLHNHMYTRSIDYTPGKHKHNYYVVVPMPQMSLNADLPVAPLPNHLTSSPIELTVVWAKTPTSLGHSPDTATVVDNPLAAGVHFQYLDLADMSEYKNVVYNYPCQIRTDNYYTTHQPTSVDDTSLDFRLSGMKNGEVTQIKFRITPKSWYDDSWDAFKGKRLKRYTLTYGGQTIYDSWENGGSSIQEISVDPSITDLSLPRMMDMSYVGPTQTYVYRGYADTLEGNFVWYTIPICINLDNVRRQDYGLGADFRDSDLVLTVWPYMQQGAIPTVETRDTIATGELVRAYVQISTSALIQCDGRSANIIL